ncbi:hypothetical protein J3458_019709 [Metarhizium acridum]|uniref:uncharacterized protein n=1 Tax=Metarhizium acridum TaxID=92637 RepID=UPI001C6D2118|nr:hypothetical protein J3458_019709 [Metarhizium acridum]
MNCSLTALERNDPPSRRKSCSACIKAKAKQRCDFALPACLRCSQSNVACEYPKRSERRATQRPANLPTTTLPVAPVLAETTISPTWLTCLNAPNMQSDQRMGDMSVFDNLDTSYMG